jgi:hypothetical protein
MDSDKKEVSAQLAAAGDIIRLHVVSAYAGVQRWHQACKWLIF